MSLGPDANVRTLLGRPVAWRVEFLRDFSLDSIVLIPHKDCEPAEERGRVLRDADFHQGMEPHTHQGGAQCMEHHFHKWPWEGQENPPHVGKGPDLIFWQGASQWIPGM